MASIEITRAVRSAVETLLAEQFNATLAQVCTDYGCTAFEIDFANPGKTYFKGPWTLEMLLQYQAAMFPCLTLHGVQGSNEHREKPRTFSGSVALQAMVLLPVSPDDIDLETLAEAVEATMYTIIESSDLIGGMTHQRLAPLWVEGATDDGAETVGGFVQGIQFQMIFEHDTE